MDFVTITKLYKAKWGSVTAWAPIVWWRQTSDRHSALFVKLFICEKLCFFADIPRHRARHNYRFVAVQVWCQLWFGFWCLDWWQAWELKKKKKKFLWSFSSGGQTAELNKALYFILKFHLVSSHNEVLPLKQPGTWICLLFCSQRSLLLLPCLLLVRHSAVIGVWSTLSKLEQLLSWYEI